jgi:hypothetical protein
VLRRSAIKSVFAGLAGALLCNPFDVIRSGTDESLKIHPCVGELAH